MSKELLKKRVSDLSKRVADILKETFKDRLVSVCLFGSGARGELRGGSDLDILVVIKSGQKSYHKRVKEIIPVLDKIRETEEYRRLEESKMNLEPCFLILTEGEIERHPSILIDISQEGIIQYDRGGFLLETLREVRESLVKLGSVKKSTPQGHYWVLKPDLKPGEVIEI
jgi:predicted nucleotidyltransferase